MVRVHNSSACSYINAGMEMYTTMRRALRIMRGFQDALNVTVIAQHVRNESNTVADLLSRRRIEQARELTEGQTE